MQALEPRHESRLSERGVPHLVSNEHELPHEVRLDMQASYLAGGAASQMPVVLRGLLQPYEVKFEDYEEASFANGPVRTGRQDERADWHIGDYDVSDMEDATPAARGDAAVTPLKIQRFKLDAGGAGRAGWQDLPKLETPRLLTAEAESLGRNTPWRSTPLAWTARAPAVARVPARRGAQVRPPRAPRDAQRYARHLR